MYKSTLAGLFLLALGTVQAQSDALNPQLPTDLKQCSTVDLTWSATANNGSSQMYYASIVSGSAQGLNGTDEVITYLARLNDTTNYEWQVGVEAGSSISLRVSDAMGNLGYSSAATVQEGDSSCLPQEQNSDGTSSTAPTPSTTSGTRATLHTSSVLVVSAAVSFGLALTTLGV